LDEANSRLFVGCRRPAKLMVMDTRTGKAVAELNEVADTDDVWYDPSARRIYGVQPTSPQQYAMSINRNGNSPPLRAPFNHRATPLLPLHPSPTLPSNSRPRATLH